MEVLDTMNLVVGVDCEGDTIQTLVTVTASEALWVVDFAYVIVSQIETKQDNS